MNTKHILRRLLPVLCTALLLVCFPFSAAATETDGAVQTEDSSQNTGETGEEERLEPDAYFAAVQSNEVEGWPQGPAVWAESAAVMDLDSGAFLYAKDIDAVKYPASITKIMTSLLALENSSCQSGSLFPKMPSTVLSGTAPTSASGWVRFFPWRNVSTV